MEAKSLCKIVESIKLANEKGNELMKKEYDNIFGANISDLKRTGYSLISPIAGVRMFSAYFAGTLKYLIESKK